MKNIFLIGPASVGKTTVGALLAERLNYVFIDVDTEFCSQIGLIPDYVKKHSYSGYCEANSLLVDRLLIEHPIDTVFATPSGFLVHEDSPHLVEKHAKLISDNAVSVLLLPHENPLQAVDMIVARQAARWNDIDLEREYVRFIERSERYRHFGDIQIFSQAAPVEITEFILDRLSA